MKIFKDVRLLFLVMLLTVGMTVVSNAAISGVVGTQYKISDILAEPDDAIQVGNKLYSNIKLDNAASSDTYYPDVDAIFLTPVIVDGQYGLQIDGGWSAKNNEYASSTIIWKESVTDGSTMNNVRWWLVGGGVSFNADNGIVQISKQLTENDPQSGPPVEIPVEAESGNLVYYATNEDKNLSAIMTFEERTEMWVTTAITAFGGNGDTGSAQLTQLYDVMVPEPTTFGLMLLGSVAFLARKRH